MYSFWEDNFTQIEYKILPKSILEVNGKTNINSFCCTSNERFQTQKTNFKFQEQNSSFNFHDTKFDISIKKLDCGKKKINKDLNKALKVDDYPNISILLKELINIDCKDVSTCEEWIDYEAITDITITCETKTIIIPIMVKKMDNESFRVTGGTSLMLCDFDVKAPTALLGLIKVKDEIDFNFDLYIDVI